MHAHIDGGRDRPDRPDSADGGAVALVHLALASSVASILRAGVRTGAPGPDGRAGVWCQPEALPLTAYAPPEPLRQALRREGSRAVMAVHVRLDASTPVVLVHPDGRAEPLTAGDAVASAALTDRGCQVFVPRTITRAEVARIGHVPRLAGAPPARSGPEPGQRPHPRPARRRLDPTQRPLAKPQLLAPLVGASDPGDADELLRSAGPPSRGDAS